MDRLKNSGFYKLKFLITPEEFQSVLKLLEPAAAQFYQTNFSRSEDTSDQVADAYRSYYEYFMTAEKREGHRPLFVYAVTVQPGDEQSGYHIRPEEIFFPRYGQWAEDILPCVMISYPKGFQIDLEDERGKYYIYGDIREHKPITYAFFEEFTGAIRKITKPLRFSAQDAEAMKEQKPFVRISPGAAQDLSQSWMFSKYGLMLNGK
ncbi:hypothetical protein [Paenibacillus sp. FSL R7-0331]|uniref:hypothetical protein n=1 Tax=Paenibacillus sp. FSL R7-0331 TaxID=1536773 RepID=UPI0004F620F0|nr:hypothetical protein [Paenibacillus sp. FSL R7-0331]AIQ53229.1 hypothetical protein R70331_17980 [Paenibacillus sp. FSL R7-0331]